MKRADGFTKVQTEFEADSVIGIWAYSDKTRTTNFISGGYEIDGKDILLTGGSFDYCDQMVFISYYSSGMVKNTIVYSEESDEYSEAVFTYAEMLVVASVSGKEDTKGLYVDNTCKCKSSLTVSVDLSSIKIGETATIDAYVENGGFPVAGTIRMVELSGKGTLSWSSLATGTVSISGEKTEAVNAISGQTQCILSTYISSVTGVWLVDADGNKTGSNLYSSYNGRTIDLLSFVANGTDLLVDYSRAGSAKNYLRGVAEGVARMTISMDVDSEEGLVQTAQVTVTAIESFSPSADGSGVIVIEDPSSSPSEGPSSSPSEGGLGGITIIGETGWSGPYTPTVTVITYSVIGPSQWNLRNQGNAVYRYSLRGSDGSSLGGTVVRVDGSGSFKLPGSIIVLDVFGRRHVVQPWEFWAFSWTTGMGRSVEVTVQGMTSNGIVSAKMTTVVVS
jgi:hypothetical protein